MRTIDIHVHLMPRCFWRTVDRGDAWYGIRYEQGRTAAGRCAPKRVSIFVHIRKPPSTYQRQLYYNCLTSSELALRFLLDQVGCDRVVLGSDWPYVQWEPSPVAWVRGLQSLTAEEKDHILWKNLERLLGL